MEKISIEVNKCEAKMLQSALLRLSEDTSIYYTSDLLKSVSLAITSEDIGDDARVKILHEFNCFMSLIMLNNEWFDILHKELSSKIELAGGLKDY